ncbi:MAG: LamG domain-containing protein, partial [Candidatus Micrarchaeota archaeon]|nr:LamG domain-containing protein [Candidatus Micrarchaeota archaeon]
YEYTPSMRGNNFITNTSLYLKYLITNGTLPNVSVGTAAYNSIKLMMGGATFATYNAEIGLTTGIAARQISVNESSPQIFQINPYSINVRYTESVVLNTTSGSYTFSIPVNASIPINNTPDLFYAQQGVYKKINFASSRNLVTVIGNTYATSGNTIGYAYGMVYSVPALTTCGTLNVPAGISSPPNSKQVIIATSDGGLLTPACLSNYAGVIAANLISPPSTMPYLNYQIGSYPALTTGEQVLLYGPGLATLNITNLVNNASQEAYFTAPLASQYLDRASGNFQKSSQNGMFTFFTYDRQAALFNNVFSVISTSQTQPSTTAYSVAAWVFPTNGNGVIENDRGTTLGSTNGHSLTLGIGQELCLSSPISPGQFFFGDNSDNIGWGIESTTAYPTNSWYFVVGTFNAPKGTLISGATYASLFNLYVNGQQVATSEWCGVGSSVDTSPLKGNGGMQIGYEAPWSTSSNSLIGDIANLQVYNQTLTAQQVYQLYQEGVEGLPISNSMLIGWYPLNGNANNYNGTSAITTTTSGISYNLLPNYQMDNMLVTPSSSNTYPIPGLLTCVSYGQCTSNYLPAVYLGTSQISAGGQTSAAYFNGQSSYMYDQLPTAGTASAPFNALTSWTYSAWINPQNNNPAGTTNTIYSEGNPCTTFQIDTTAQTELEFSASNNGALYVAGPTSSALAKGSFNNVVITMSGAGLGTGVANFYVNGKLVSPSPIVTPGGQNSEEVSTPNGANNKKYFELGGAAGIFCSPAQGLSPFLGSMSNVQLYNTALSGAQVSALYQEGIDGSPLQAADQNLIAWYPLYQNGNDYSGNGLNAIPNAVGYTYVPTTYSQPLGTIGEWQYLGFPSHP